MTRTGFNLGISLQMTMIANHEGYKLREFAASYRGAGPRNPAPVFSKSNLCKQLFLSYNFQHKSLFYIWGVSVHFISVTLYSVQCLILSHGVAIFSETCAIRALFPGNVVSVKDSPRHGPTMRCGSSSFIRGWRGGGGR